MIFYNFSDEKLKKMAALKLCEKKWVYDKNLKTWFLNPNLSIEEPKEHIFFNIKEWKEEKIVIYINPHDVVTENDFKNN
jgi:hypothetical protein